MQIKIMKRLRFISVLMIIFFVLVLAGCEDSVELGENEVKVKNSESTFVGTNYEKVVEKLQEWGFTNIETEAVYDIFWGITKEGTTKSVTIDGSSGFKSGDVLNKNVAVVVTYSMKESNDPAKKTYEVTWKNDDGTTLRTDKVLVNTMPSFGGKEPTKAAINEKKYVFNGWTPEIEIVNSNQTYTAMYTEAENLFTITFNLDGGQWDLENTQSVIYNGKITNIKPIKEGYDFNGWVIKGYFSDTKFDTETSIKEEYTLTATWTVAKYTVSFDLDGGTWSRSNEQSLNYNGKITTTKPTKDGHEFVAWLLDDKAFDVSTPITSDLNLKAQWYLPNYEDILVGRWETRDTSMQGKGFSFLEFDGTFYDSSGERKSGATDFNHNWGSFTLYGNKIGFYFVDAGTIYFTISYNDNKLVLKNKDYVDIVMYQTESEPNSIAWKWQHLYEFAKTQSDLKSDISGYYYEITLTLNLRNISPNNKLVESNNQAVKVYTNKNIIITLNYIGVNEPEVEMVVILIFKHDEIVNNKIINSTIQIESENYVMYAKKGTTEIEFDEGANQFLFTTTKVENYGTQFPGSASTFIYDLMIFTERALSETANHLLVEHDIYMFTK